MARRGKTLRRQPGGSRRPTGLPSAGRGGPGGIIAAKTSRTDTGPAAATAASRSDGSAGGRRRPAKPNTSDCAAGAQGPPTQESAARETRISPHWPGNATDSNAVGSAAAVPRTADWMGRSRPRRRSRAASPSRARSTGAVAVADRMPRHWPGAASASAARTSMSAAADPGASRSPTQNRSGTKPRRQPPRCTCDPLEIGVISNFFAAGCDGVNNSEETVAQ
jgi:hypothetical protein